MVKIVKPIYLRKLPSIQQEKAQALTTITLTLIAISVFGIFAISPTLSTIANLQKQLEDSKFVNEKLDEKIKNLSILQSIYSNNVFPDLQIILSAIPQSPTVTLFVAQLQSLAEKTQVNITRLQVSQVEISAITMPTQQPNSQPSFSFTLESKGTEKQVMEFFSTLLNFERVITIESFAIIYDNSNNQKTQISIKGKAYFQQ